MTTQKNIPIREQNLTLTKKIFCLKILVHEMFDWPPVITLFQCVTRTLFCRDVEQTSSGGESCCRLLYRNPSGLVLRFIHLCLCECRKFSAGLLPSRRGRQKILNTICFAISGIFFEFGRQGSCRVGDYVPPTGCIYIHPLSGKKYLRKASVCEYSGWRCGFTCTRKNSPWPPSMMLLCTLATASQRLHSSGLIRGEVERKRAGGLPLSTVAGVLCIFPMTACIMCP